MNIKPIRNDDDLTAAFKHLESIFQAKAGTPEADEMEILVTLIEAYENKHYPIQKPDPIAAIRFVMEQNNLQPKDMQPYLGAQSKVSEVLSGKRSLSLTMIKRLHDGLGMPYTSLLV